MRSRASDSDVQDEPSLYEMIVDATGIEYGREDFPGGQQDYKNKLVRHFGQMTGDDFDELPEEVREWVNEATEVFNANRRTKEEPEDLPEIEGLVEPPPPPPARRARVTVADDDDAPPPPARRARVVAAPEPEPEPEPEEEEAEEAPPPRATRTRATPARATAARPAAKPAPAPRERSTGRNPDSGRYAKVMPHYLKDREITVPELQAAISKTDGESYSETTLDRTLAACVAITVWLEHNGVDLKRLSR